MTNIRRCVTPVGVVALAAGAVLTAPAANADNRRLNDSVAANVYTVQRNAGCDTDIKINPKLRLAAQWHTNDVLNNRALDGDIGSDGTTTADRARNAGYAGAVAETVAINPALAISGIELINQWYYRPDYYAIMADCSNVQIGVWSESHFDRTVVVAVYGKGDSAPPVLSDIRDFGQVPGWTP
ncbi:MAG: CAP domain-containing protein [Mycobacterium sp.]|nr:CAP domain-containing protein [Mycobacterium sp.]